MVNKKVTQAAPQPAVPQRKVTPPRAKPAASGATTTDPAKPGPAQRTAPPRQSAVAARVEGVRKGFRETVAELRKVQWPDRLTTRNLTLVVIGMSAALAIILGALDAGLTRLIEWLVAL